MQEPRFVRDLFSSIATRYDFANHVLSGGMDFFWRRRAAQIVKAWRPERILDLATGSGDFAITLSRRCPESDIIGVDFCHAMLLEAKAKGVRQLVVADGMRLPFPDASFDAVTIAFGLRNMESWPGALNEMSRVLKNQGHLLILDFSTPVNALMATGYRFYLHGILPRIAGILTGEKSAYEYLAGSIERFPRGETMKALINVNGFQDASAEPLTCGIVSLYTATRR